MTFWTSWAVGGFQPIPWRWRQTGDWGGSQRQGMGWNPPTAHEVQKVIAEMKVFYDALLVPGAVQCRSKDGQIHGYLCGDAKSGVYLLSVNASDDKVSTEITLPALAGKTLEPLFGAPAAKISGSTFPLSLPGLGTAVWRVK